MWDWRLPNLPVWQQKRELPQNQQILRAIALLATRLGLTREIIYTESAGVEIIDAVCRSDCK